MAGNRDRSGRRRKAASAPAAANPAPTAAARAIAAIVGYHRWRQSSIGSVFGKMEGPPAEAKLADAAGIINAGLQPADLTATQLPTLLSALDQASDRQSARAIREMVGVAVEARWAEFQHSLRETAIVLLKQAQLRSDLDFERFLTDWPRLASDPQLCTQAVDVLESDPSLVGFRVWSLRKVHGDGATSATAAGLGPTPDTGPVKVRHIASQTERWGPRPAAAGLMLTIPAGVEPPAALG